LAYGVGDIYGGGSFLIISLLFMFFLTDIVGIPPYLAGIVMLPGKIWDAISDPLMGFISDRTKSRFGRRRIYFLLGMLPVGLSFIMLWVTIRFENIYFSFLYYVIAFILFRTAFTMVMIPYSALNAEMSCDYKTRMRLSGARMMCSQFSSLVSAVLPKLFIDTFYAQRKEEGFLVMSIIFGIFYMVPWIIVFFGTWEMETCEPTSPLTFSGFFSELFSMRHNRSFRLHMGMYIASYSAMDVLMTLFIYYLTYYIGNEKLFSTCVGAMLLAQVSMLPIYVIISNRKGKGFAYMLGLSIWGIGLIITSMFTPNTPTLIIVGVSALMGIGLSAGTMVPWAILPSVTDVDEIITGKKRAGSYAGAMTFIRKIVNAITIFFIGVILDLIGYQKPIILTIDGVTQTIVQQQSETTLFCLRILFFLIPFILIAIGIMIARKFKITPQTHAILIAEIERLKRGGKKSEVDRHTKVVCEELTGLPYERLMDQRGTI
ncbi:MAG: MFS transporter, partial [Spirochaetes bacterium]|nr:MFS transporter [Spirochaetota bacterium]